jgi:hypothetical protein
VPFPRRGAFPLERIIPASSLPVVLAVSGYVERKKPAFGGSLVHYFWVLQFGSIEGFVAHVRTATFKSKGGSPHAER